MLITQRPHATLFAAVLAVALFIPSALADSWTTIRDQAEQRFGTKGAQAAEFLATNRPPGDDTIDPEIVLDAIRVSLRARERYPWTQSLSDERFFNDVLPYAVVNEPRDRSRTRVYELTAPFVAEAKTAAEAAQIINRELFALTGVRYSTERRRPHQNTLETLELGLASCTGLSIMLIDACRSVGIPARLVGIASWPGRGGNHSWVEIHDGERWRFMGAAEHDPAGLDRGWFTGAASQAIEGHTLHAIWATSWRQTGQTFPLSWSANDTSVPGVEVTNRYKRPGDAEAEPMLALRLWSSRGGPRLASTITLTHENTTHESSTHTDPVDINRVAEFPAIDLRPLRLLVTVPRLGTRFAVLDDSHQPGRVIELYWDELAMPRDDAEAAMTLLWTRHIEREREARAAELKAEAITLGDSTLRFMRRSFGDPPHSGPSLWISMHGGGGAPTEVNDRQWQNQIRLYEPDEGIYIAPRAPSDTWNLWHRPEVDALFDRLIESATIAWGVDPNRVYLMGYSAGGDGVYQLAPRMADRFAAAAMMAGHPNDATPDGLRNLPFALFMGADDSAYNRNAVAREWENNLDELRTADPGGYDHLVRIYPGLGHWMEGKDAEALPWMAERTRDPWPRRIVWRQGNTPHERFYWLAVAPEDAARGHEIRAAVDGQTITIDSNDVPRVELMLSDDLLNLDEPVRVITNGKPVFEGIILRTESAMRRSLDLRADRAMIASSSLVIQLGAEEASD